MKGRFKMIRIRQVLCVIGFAMLFQALNIAAQPLDSVPSTAPSQKLIEAFAGKATTRYYSDPRIRKKVLVSERILEGFGYGPLRLTLKDGIAIYWGFRDKEATTESVAIFDAKGRPRLLAAMDSIPWCDGWHCEPFTSIADYQASADKTFLKNPAVDLFVRDKRDLETYLPYLKRWLQAKILGFNVDCREPKMSAACKFVMQTEWLGIIQVRAYLLPSMRPLDIPKVEAADVPLEAFGR
ncbi:hypothetical protein [Massilia sp.]|uniref:hypothetical protein n=1 Tax=Massilia sp. TaxID=1882437 RepID=UPI00391BAFC0